MTKTLEGLWYGNISPHESFMDNSRQNKKLLSLMSKNREKLADSLTEKQKETLEKYDMAVDELNSLAEQSAFQYGFSLGVRLMMESIFIELTENESK